MRVAAARSLVDHDEDRLLRPSDLTRSICSERPWGPAIGSRHWPGDDVARRRCAVGGGAVDGSPRRRPRLRPVGVELEFVPADRRSSATASFRAPPRPAPPASGVAAASASFSPSSSRPSSTLTVCSTPLRERPPRQPDLPTGVSATTRGRSRISLTSLPSNLMITSPGWMPALSAGPPSMTPATSAPLRLVEAEAFGDLVGDRLDAHAEPAAPGLAEIARAGRRRRLASCRRDREADADRAARRRDDGGVDADHLAVHVEQRAAGIAAVDGGVGLDEVVIGTGIDVAVARRDDADASPSRRGRTGCRSPSPSRRPACCRNRRRSPR